MTSKQLGMAGLSGESQPGAALETECGPGSWLKGNKPLGQVKFPFFFFSVLPPKPTGHLPVSLNPREGECLGDQSQVVTVVGNQEG